MIKLTQINLNRLLMLFTLVFSIYSYSQNAKRIPGCIINKNKNTKEFSIPKTRGISEFPKAVSLKDYYPEVGDQGFYGTCTAWATTYASFTALKNIKNNRLGNTLKEEECFSPQFTYDLIKRETDDNCSDGSKIYTALDLIKRIGSLSLSEYPYNCNILNDGKGIERLKNNPSYETKFNEIISSANKNRLEDFIDLGRTNVVEKIKYALNNKYPVIISIWDYGNLEANLGKDSWVPENLESNTGGHAISLVSYNDDKNGGSFEIMNSWGKEWGNSGYCWIRYSDLEKVIGDAYALTDIKTQSDISAEFYDFNINIKLIGDDSKPFEFNTEKLIYSEDDNFYVGSIDNSEYNFLYPLESKKFQIALSSNDNLYFYLLSKTPSSTVSVDYPVSSKDSNLLDSNNSGLILPKNAQDYFSIENFENGWFSNEFLVLFSKKQIDINSIIQSHKSEKFESLNSFVRSVFKDNIVVSNLNVVDGENSYFNDKNKMNITVVKDNNYILPIIINLKEKPKPKPIIIKPINKKKKKK